MSTVSKGEVSKNVSHKAVFGYVEAKYQEDESLWDNETLKVRVLIWLRFSELGNRRGDCL